MAYSPCPKCQSKAEFDEIFSTIPESLAMDAIAFVVQSGKDESLLLLCNKDARHVWLSHEALATDLKEAGYFYRRGWSDYAHQYDHTDDFTEPNKLETVRATKQVRIPFERGASGLVFDILFPESANFRSSMGPDAKHCLCRVMEHLGGRTKNSYPSTHEGVLIPVEAWKD
jgi:hypothetical protein